MSNAGEYIYILVIAAIIVSVLRSILPGKGVAATTLKLATGMFLVTVVIAPLVKMRFDNMLSYISSIETDASAIITEAQKSSEEEIKTVIAQQTEAYILSRASDLGASIQVEITFQQDVSYIPESVKIIGPVAPLVKKQLSALIANELGISEDLQIWQLM